MTDDKLRAALEDALEPTEWIARGGEVVECDRCGTQYANASIAMGHRCPPSLADDPLRLAAVSVCRLWFTYNAPADSQHVRKAMLALRAALQEQPE